LNNSSSSFHKQFSNNQHIDWGPSAFSRTSARPFKVSAVFRFYCVCTSEWLEDSRLVWVTPHQRRISHHSRICENLRICIFWGLRVLDLSDTCVSRFFCCHKEAENRYFCLVLILLWWFSLIQKLIK